MGTYDEIRDPVTGLLNRYSLDVILGKEIAQAGRTSDNLPGLLFISIEELGKVNEAFGPSTGDLFLRNSGLRIQECIRAGDYVFRFAGNELACLLVHLEHSTDVARVARAITEQVRLPYHHQGTEIRIGCHVGIAVYPDDGRDTQTILQNAGAAMHQARRTGADFLFYNSHAHFLATERLVLQAELHKAFERNQFHLVYQPIVDCSGRIIGAEALIRWEHPRKGLLMPADFLPLAVETGVIRSISEWAVHAAAAQAALWSERYDIYLSVNLSAEDFANPQLREVLSSALQRAGVARPSLLKLEITETQCMVNPDVTIAQMNRLTEEGFDIFIDDFGKGNSSLGWLKHLPAGTIKIDRLFVDESTRSPGDFEFLTDIVALVRNRRKAVILEGVATTEQHERLKALTVQGLQGFYFSLPLSVEVFDDLLSTDARLPLSTDGTGRRDQGQFTGGLATADP